MADLHMPFLDLRTLRNFVDSLMMEMTKDGVILRYEVSPHPGGKKFILDVWYEKKYRYTKCDQHLDKPDRRGICEWCHGWFTELG